MKYYLAIDIGASSGRHIIGWQEGGQIRTEEVFRFPNGVVKENGHLVWNLPALLSYVKEGIAKAKEKYPKIESLSVDTWGVDYVLMDGDKEIFPCYAHRDSRTEAVIPEVHEKISFSELYRKTGSQFQPFNTLYQFYEDHKAGRLEMADDLLMIPEYLLYRLSGTKVREFTNATTTGMISSETLSYDQEIVQRLGLPERLFGKLTQPGEVLGIYEGIKVVLCATHDTASAVEGIPMEGNEPYISSGTWSLLGIKIPKPLTDEKSEAANYSNEGGVGYTRYQKNIMGMWMVNNLKAELCPDTPFDEIVEAAAKSTFSMTVDADSTAFLAPESMKGAFDEALGHISMEPADYFRCAFLSLAQSYSRAIREMEENTGITTSKIYIVGGGARNTLLNEMTEKASGKQVIALPIEATALGNLKIQMEADK